MTNAQRITRPIDVQLEDEMADDAKGWPYDAWGEYLAARAKAIRSMIDAGHTPAQVREALNLHDDQQVAGIYAGTKPK